VKLKLNISRILNKLMGFNAMIIKKIKMVQF